METYLTQLWEQLSRELNHPINSKSPVRDYKSNLQIIQSTLKEIKQFSHAHIFSSMHEEVQFYKEYIPNILSEKMYYETLLDLEIERTSINPEKFPKLLRKKLSLINRFFTRYKWLYEYYLTGETLSDTLFFSRQTALEETYYDEYVCTTYGFRFAQIKAKERVKSYLYQELQKLESPGETDDLAEDLDVEWKGSIAEAIELVTGVQTTQTVYIHKQPATIKQVAILFERVFHKKLGDYYNRDHQNRQRKKNSTPYIDKMKSGYLDRLNKLND